MRHAFSLLVQRSKATSPPKLAKSPQGALYRGGESKRSLFTFADTKLVTKIIFLTVKLTPQPWATFHAIHA